MLLSVKKCVEVKDAEYINFLPKFPKIVYICIIVIYNKIR